MGEDTIWQQKQFYDDECVSCHSRHFRRDNCSCQNTSTLQGQNVVIIKMCMLAALKGVLRLAGLWGLGILHRSENSWWETSNGDTKSQRSRWTAQAIVVVSWYCQYSLYDYVVLLNKCNWCSNLQICHINLYVVCYACVFTQRWCPNCHIPTT